MALLSNFRNSFTGAVMLGAAAAVSLAPTTADAQDQQVATAPAGDRLQVIFRVGAGPDSEDRALAARAFAEGISAQHNCDITVTDGGPFMGIRAESETGQNVSNPSAAAVGAVVRDWCGPA